MLLMFFCRHFILWSRKLCVTWHPIFYFQFFCRTVFSKDWSVPLLPKQNLV